MIRNSWVLLTLLSWGGLDLALTASIAQAQSRNQVPPRNITRWLLCEECTEGELDSVLVSGDSAIDPLASALQGPPKEGIENMRRQIEAMYDRTPDMSLAKDPYVNYYLANYTALYQRRAAVALDSINTPRADSVLTDALHRGGYRADVMRVIGRSIGIDSGALRHGPVDSARTPTVGISAISDSGAFQHGALGAFVRVNPTVLVRDSSSGKALSGIHVRFQVDSGGGTVDDSATTDASGRASVRWRLGASDSVNVLSAFVAGEVVRFRALGHPAGLRLVFLTQPTDVRDRERMTPPVRIAVHDEWGAQVPLNDPDGVTVIVEGSRTRATIPIVNGIADLSDLRFIGRGRVRITARGLGTVAYSAPFEIRPS
jgi:hypothetical protein